MHIWSYVSKAKMYIKGWDYFVFEKYFEMSLEVQNLMKINIFVEARSGFGAVPSGISIYLKAALF